MLISINIGGMTERFVSKNIYFEEENQQAAKLIRNRVIRQILMLKYTNIFWMGIHGENLSVPNLDETMGSCTPVSFLV